MKTVGCNKYIELMNALIKKYDGYKEGMRVINVPVDSEYPSGYKAIAKNINDEIALRGLIGRAREELKKEYILDPNIS